MISYIKTVFYRHPFLMTFIVVYLLWTLRYPDCLTDFNFYAEDGKEFIESILKEGLIESILKPFNGSIISVLYLISFISIKFLHFFNLPFWYLPTLQSVIVNAVYSFIFSLPVLLFSQHKISSVFNISLFCIISCLLPIHPYQYEIIGSLGNLKWMFLYLSFLLLIYRYYVKIEYQSPLNTITSKNYIKNFILIDVGILICFYSLPSVILVYFLLTIEELFSFINNKFRFQISTSSFLFSSIFALLPLFVSLTSKHSQPGYLDTPYILKNTIEIFVARTALYPLFPFLYKHLNDILSLFLFIVVLGVLFYNQKFKKPIRAGIFLVFASIFLFVMNRPGISASFDHYQTTSYSRFFYTQNLIILFIIYFYFLRQFTLPYGKKIICLYFFSIYSFYFFTAHSPSANFSQTPNLKSQINSICSDFSSYNAQLADTNINLTLYPTPAWTLNVNIKDICK